MNCFGKEQKKLGFGFMRLPGNDNEYDIPQIKKMVDLFMSKGFTYFDTAYVYDNGRSEKAIKETLVDRYPRESFQIATKFPVWKSTGEDLKELFLTSLERTGAGYFDFYLLHSMDAKKVEKADEIGLWEYLLDLKSQGLIKHLGFSFHDEPEVLEGLLEKHSKDTDFVQLQINYHDWENTDVKAKECYEIVQKYGKPIIVMEPIRGGSLAFLTPEIQQVFKSVRPEMSVASFALRYAASLDGVMTVLSGMSSLEQVEDNVSFMENFEPLNEAECMAVKKVADILKNTPTIPCTSCRYCVDGCPQNINIPKVLSALNDYRLYGDFRDAKDAYEWGTREGGKAADCIACGACESVCPQHIEIIERLKQATEMFK